MSLLTSGFDLYKKEELEFGGVDTQKKEPVTKKKRS